MLYNDPDLDFEHYFTFQPVLTDERQQKHDRINACALQFAACVYNYLPINDPQRNDFLNFIQYVRTMMNQQVMVDEVKQLEQK